MTRVAYFADSFHEVNGVALTSRMLEDHARVNGYPFLSIHTGPQTRCWDLGSVRRFELALGRWTIRLEQDLRFDVGFARHQASLLDELRRFAPEVIHVTGPSHLGLLGAWAARQVKVPLVASWHTNIHEYAGRRLEQSLPLLPRSIAASAGHSVEALTLAAALRFYSEAKCTLAPNPELTAMLNSATGRPSALMKRGVDTVLFNPAKRSRTDNIIRIGFAGRLSPEKGVRWLKTVEDELERADVTDYEFWIAGHGSEADWLRQHLRRKQMPGVLKGEALACFYADLDLFAFPSQTDTYGNVIQEAMASGVPCVVTAGGGPKYLVRHGIDGLVAHSGAGGEKDFAAACAHLVRESGSRANMAREARRAAESAAWAKVFESVYGVYAACASADATPVN